MSALRRGRKPPQPMTAALDDDDDGGGGGGGGGGDAVNPRGSSGWQLHHSSSGLPFYYNRATRESVWARSITGTDGAPTRNDPSWDNTNSGLQQIFSGRSVDNSTSGGGSTSTTTTSSSSSSTTTTTTTTGSGGSSTSSSSSGTSPASSLSLGDFRGSGGSGDDISTSDSSETVSTSLSRGSYESSRTSSSSEDSWTESMEMRFRQTMKSEEGRKMLADEVEVLAARQTKHSKYQVARGLRGKRRVRRKGGSPNTRRIKPVLGEGKDVEMALLGTKDAESNEDSGGGGGDDDDASSSSGSSGSFSLNMSSGSDGGSDLSLLTSDVVLERLEKVEQALLLARAAAVYLFCASYGIARQGFVMLRTAVWRGATRAQRRFSSGSQRPRSPPDSFSPAVF